MSLSGMYFTQFLAPKIGCRLPGVPESYTARFHICLKDIAESWAIDIDAGHLTRVEITPETAVSGLHYVIDEAVFLSLASGRLKTAEAFFKKKLQIKGGLFQGLKIGEVLAKFFAASPWLPPPSFQVSDGMKEVTGMPADTFEENFTTEVKPGVTITSSMACPEHGAPSAVFVAFPPDPTLGGGLTNNVVQALHCRAVEAGMLSVVVGYRGTDGNDIEGMGVLEYWDCLRKAGEMKVVTGDCQKVLESVCASHDRHVLPTCYAGYSFGGFVAMSLLDRNSCNYCAVISPPIGDYPFEKLSTVQVPTTFFHGTKDEFCSESELSSLARRWHGEMVSTGSTDHFHRGQEAIVASAVISRFKEAVS